MCDTETDTKACSSDKGNAHRPIENKGSACRSKQACKSTRHADMMEDDPSNTHKHADSSSTQADPSNSDPSTRRHHEDPSSTQASMQTEQAHRRADPPFKHTDSQLHPSGASMQIQGNACTRDPSTTHKHADQAAEHGLGCAHLGRKKFQRFGHMIVQGTQQPGQKRDF